MPILSALLAAPLAASPAQTPYYRVTLLDQEAGAVVQAHCLGDDGVVGGAHTPLGGFASAATWSPDGSRLDLEGGTVASAAFAVARGGQHVGGRRAGGVEAAWAWGPRLAGWVGPGWSASIAERALAVNAHDEVVGIALFDAQGELVAQPWYRAADGGFVDLRSLGLADAVPAAIARDGTVVGTDVDGRYPNGAAAFAWNPQRPGRLVLSTAFTPEAVRLTDLSDSGVACGSLLDGLGLPRTALRLDAATLAPQLLPPPLPTGVTATAALAASDFRAQDGGGPMVVGFARRGSTFEATVWIGDVGFTLEALTGGRPAGLELESVTAVNALGELCGVAWDATAGQARAFRASPALPTSSPPLPGVAGASNRIHVQGLTPGATAWFVLGTQPGRLTVGCVELDIADAQLAGSAVVDADGRATLDVLLPRTTAGLEVLGQVFEAGACRATPVQRVLVVE